MSYIYLQEQGEESSADCFSDIDQSVLSKLTNTAEKSYCKDRGTEYFPDSQSGMTCKHLTANLGEELSMLSVVDSHVKTLVQPEQPQEERASKENGQDYGEKWPELLAKWDQNTSSWKTPQCSLLEGLDVFSETWPQWGIMQDGAVYPLPMLVPTISGTEFGYLPTPTASLGTFDMPILSNLKTCEMKETTGRRPSGAKIGSSLSWHQEFIYEWQRTGGELNAEWIEVLMGWPIGWTDLQPLGTDKFRSWLQQHGGFSQESYLASQFSH
jgi:hypothetical protein